MKPDPTGQMTACPGGRGRDRRKTTRFLCFTMAIFLLGAPGLDAKRLYTWTDRDGKLHITDAPPPESAEVIDVLRYRPRPDKDLNAVQTLRERETYLRLKEEAEAAVNSAVEKAREAAEQAAAARSVADEVRKKTEAMAAKATKRKKDRLELSRQKELQNRTEALALEAERQASDAKALVRQAKDQLAVVERLPRSGASGTRE